MGDITIMKALKIIREIIFWLFMIFFLITITAMNGALYYALGVLTVLLSCPLLIKFILKKFNVKHPTLIRVLLILICFIINYHAITNSSYNQLRTATHAIISNEIQSKYSEYETIEIIDYYIKPLDYESHNIQNAEVHLEFILKNDTDTKRIKEIYDIQYDDSKKECVKIELR